MTYYPYLSPELIRNGEAEIIKKEQEILGAHTLDLHPSSACIQAAFDGLLEVVNGGSRSELGVSSIPIWIIEVLANRVRDDG